MKNIKIFISTYCTLLFLFLFSATCFGQQHTLSGVIIDEFDTPLENANIFAYPSTDNPVVYVLSDENGQFKVNLLENVSYDITVSYQGYTPYTFTVTLTKAENKTIQLKAHTEELKELVIEYTPIVVKKDSIVYLADAFATGEEQKLRDLLKKLPNVEVDKEGNVKANGKMVSKLFVENSEFFSGNTKLGVNNIPADVVEKIMLLDNYNDVEMVKEHENTDDVALNIQLKEDKKNFIFGDLNASAGMKKRYLLQPTLFRYTPKNNFNFIADFNNTGARSFTLKDYLAFNGYNKDLILTPQSYRSNLDTDLQLFLNANNLRANQTNFLAGNTTFKIGNHTEFTAYIITSNTNNKKYSETFRTYNDSESTIENEINQQKINTKFGIGAIKIRYQPTKSSDLTSNTFFKLSDSKANSYNNGTVNKATNRKITTNSNFDNITFKQDIDWYKSFNDKHLTRFKFNYEYKKIQPKNNWLLDYNYFQNQIPVLPAETYNIINEKEFLSNQLSFNFKHYWTLNRLNHIYIIGGGHLANDSYQSNDYQLIDNSINLFDDEGFKNDINIKYKDLYLGVNYKFRLFNTIFMPGATYHQYLWNIKQSNSTNKEMGVLLPELEISKEINKTEKLTFNYNKLTRFPSITQFANRLTLTNFNSLYRGNENLSNETYHQLRLFYNKFNIGKRYSYNISLNHKFMESFLSNISVIEGGSYIQTPFLSESQKQKTSARGSFNKEIGYYKFTISASTSHSIYKELINLKEISSISNNHTFLGKVRTNYREFPNLSLVYTKSISNFKGKSNANFVTDIFDFTVDYWFLNDFYIKGEYKFEKYTNKNFRTKNTFNIANISLLYKKDDSLWTYEIIATNIFNIKYKQRNTISNILLSESKIYILPRMLLLKVSYKL